MFFIAIEMNYIKLLFKFNILYFQNISENFWTVVL